MSMKALVRLLSKAFLIREDDEFLELQIRAPGLDCEEDSHEFLFVCGQTTRLRAERLTEECQRVTVLH